MQRRIADDAMLDLLLFLRRGDADPGVFAQVGGLPLEGRAGFADFERLGALRADGEAAEGFDLGAKAALAVRALDADHGHRAPGADYVLLYVKDGELRT